MVKYVKIDHLLSLVPPFEPKQHEQLELHQAPNDLRESLNIKSVVDVALQAKPKRLDQYVKQTSKFVEEGTYLNLGGQTSSDNLGNVVNLSDFQEGEDADWTRAEGLIETGDKEDVELVSCNTKGFIVSFGSLVGFLPYRNLNSKWKFFAFETWLKQKGLDPSMYKHKSFDTDIKMFYPDSSPSPEIDGKARLQVGDIVKCCIQKIAYFGIFVELFNYLSPFKDKDIEDIRMY
ncbi:uncharacterized protein [Phaseolus vulgaris]|uniref:uncharacterized protein n=1 Tax=Phaseolus vulgaris TaxID=3885 RepID=UPI0035CAD067